MHLSKIEILNFMDAGKVSLTFKNRVTFITGGNGSGKSSLLNVIYDSLNFADEKKQPPTSKNRFWGSEMTFSSKIMKQCVLAPQFEKEHIEELELLVDSEKNKQCGFFRIDFIKKLKELHQKKYTSRKHGFNSISYSEELKGDLIIRATREPSDYVANDYDQELLADGKTCTFLFQEDRRTLHNVDKSNIDLSLDYWKIYQNSIDDRFLYIRDALQIHESQINRSISDSILKVAGKLDELDELSEYKEARGKSIDVETMLRMLNKYFIQSGKEITRDESNKITLKKVGSSSSLPWHLLSRGEKTLIYLFVVTFLYKDKVNIFLFDEPEISLHVKWQKNLIKDLSELASENQFIIATHSPSLVKNGWLSHCLEIKA